MFIFFTIVVIIVKLFNGLFRETLSEEIKMLLKDVEFLQVCITLH